MEFLNNVASYGIPQGKPKKRINEAEQLSRMRENFATRVSRQISLITSGSDERKGSWYVRESDSLGQAHYVVSLRNGAKLLPLSGAHTHLKAPSSEQAVAFYQQAMAACERGELDAILIQTSRKPKKKKKDEPTPALASAETP